MGKVTISGMMGTPGDFLQGRQMGVERKGISGAHAPAASAFVVIRIATARTHWGGLLRRTVETVGLWVSLSTLQCPLPPPSGER